MKPRTKAQVAVFKLSKSVTPIKAKLERWAQKDCNEHLAFSTKNKFWCTNCGTEHPTNIIKGDTVKCPKCRMGLKVQASRKRKHFQEYFVAYAEVLGQYQVIRLFLIYSNHRIGQFASVQASECIMQFIPEDVNKIIYVAKTRNMGQGHPTCGDLEIRVPNMYKHYLYNPYPEKFHPSSKFKDECVKYGIDHELQGMTFISAYRILKKDNKAETLIKAKQFELFSQCYDASNRIDRHWASIKIAIRNNYKVSDGRSWLDYLDLLEFFGKDLRSPKYIFPEDFHTAHNKLVAKKRAVDKKQEIALAKKRAFESEKAYKADKSKFFGLVFTSGKFTIKVLESVQEFVELGDALKHCVFTNKYYKKENSLVFGAFLEEKPIEAIEVSLTEMKILQSRGLQNLPSKFHDEIVKIMKKKLPHIQKLYKSIQATA